MWKGGIYMFIPMILAFVVGVALLIGCAIQMKKGKKGIGYVAGGILAVVLIFVSIMLALPQ